MHISQSLLNEYDRMVLQLYQARDIEDLAMIMLKGLHRIIPYENGVFFPIKPGSYLFCKPLQVNLPENLFQQYENYYQDYDIYRMKVFSQLTIPVVDRCSDFMDFIDWEKNEHRLDFLIPNKMYYLAGMQLFYNGDLVGDISIHRAKDSPDFTDGEMQVLQMCAGHFQAAFTCLKKDEAGRNIISTLSRSQTGVIVFNYKFERTYINAQGETILSLLGERIADKLKKVCSTFSEARRKNPNNLPSFNGIFCQDQWIVSYNLISISQYDRSLSFMVSLDCSENSGAQKQRLTEREKEILQLITRGFSNKEIGDYLFISSETVKTHIKSLFKKTGTNSRTELACKALNQD